MTEKNLIAAAKKIKTCLAILTGILFFSGFIFMRSPIYATALSQTLRFYLTGTAAIFFIGTISLLQYYIVKNKTDKEKEEYFAKLSTTNKSKISFKAIIISSICILWLSFYIGTFNLIGQIYNSFYGSKYESYVLIPEKGHNTTKHCKTCFEIYYELHSPQFLPVNSIEIDKKTYEMIPKNNIALLVNGTRSIFGRTIERFTVVNDQDLVDRLYLQQNELKSEWAK